MGMLLYLGAALLAFLFVAHFWDRASFRRRAARRAGESFETFRTALTAEDAPEDVIRAVYQLFQSFAAVPEFPVRADDHIDRVYSVASEDLDAGVKRVLAECGYCEPSEAQRALMPPVHTVRDLVRAILKCPKAE